MSSPEIKKRHVQSANGSTTNMDKDPPKPKHQSRTLTWDHIYDWQMDNRYIVSGYRRSTADFRTILMSLTYVHNETCNVYTHLIGALILPFLAMLVMRLLSEPRFIGVTGADYFMFGMFFLSAECCLIISVLYHLNMSHSRDVEQFWLRMDLLGILIVTGGIHISGINYIFPCEPKLQKTHWTTIIVSGLVTAIMVFVPRFQRWRTVRTCAYIAVGATSFIPLIHGCKRYGLDYMLQYSGLKYYLMELSFYGGSALLYAFRLPERLSPGTFDIWGASHQLFHVAILCALYSHTTALLQAFSAYHRVDLCSIMAANRDKAS